MAVPASHWSLLSATKRGSAFGWQRSSNTAFPDYAAAGVVPFAYCPERRDVYALLAVQKGKKRNEYTLPGGKVKPTDGCDPRRTAAREAHEETHGLLAEADVFAALAVGGGDFGLHADPRVASGVRAAQAIDVNCHGTDGHGAAGIRGAIIGAGATHVRCPSPSAPGVCANGTRAHCAGAGAVASGIAPEAGTGAGTTGADRPCTGVQTPEGAAEAKASRRGPDAGASPAEELVRRSPGSSPGSSSVGIPCGGPVSGPGSSPGGHPDNTSGQAAPGRYFGSGRYMLFPLHLPAMWHLPQACAERLAAGQRHPEAAKVLGLSWVSLESLTTLREQGTLQDPRSGVLVACNTFIARSVLPELCAWLFKAREDMRRHFEGRDAAVAATGAEHANGSVGGKVAAGKAAAADADGAVRALAGLSLQFGPAQRPFRKQGG